MINIYQSFIKYIVQPLMPVFKDKIGSLLFLLFLHIRAMFQTYILYISPLFILTYVCKSCCLNVIAVFSKDTVQVRVIFKTTCDGSYSVWTGIVILYDQIIAKNTVIAGDEYGF